MMAIEIERLARLEERVNALEGKVDEMNGKLDDLLALKNKGAGAFWFFNLIVATGIVGFIYSLFGNK